MSDTLPTTAALSESLHVLITEPVRAAVMGLAVINAREAGPNVRPREGESVRLLLEDAINRIREQAPSLHEQALAAGREELKARGLSDEERLKLAPFTEELIETLAPLYGEEVAYEDLDPLASKYEVTGEAVAGFIRRNGANIRARRRELDEQAWAGQEA